MIQTTNNSFMYSMGFKDKKGIQKCSHVEFINMVNARNVLELCKVINDQDLIHLYCDIEAYNGITLEDLQTQSIETLNNIYKPLTDTTLDFAISGILKYDKTKLK